jgi:cytochrome c oxidase subunit 4
MSHSSPESHEHIELGHILPRKVYLWVFIALLVLTVITLMAAGIDFGNFNLVVAMLIASVKALLVALYFMHLKYEHPLTWLYAAFPIILLAIMIGGIFIDNPLRRDGKSYVTGDYHEPRSNQSSAADHEHHH